MYQFLAPSMSRGIEVALLGTARSLQSELNQIALTADTSTSKGINNVLTETTRALLQHPDYFISAYSSVNTTKRFAAAKKLFNRLSVEERGKFDEETLVNVNNIKKQIKRRPKATGTSNEFIVITILAVVKGVVEIPTSKGSVELKKVLQKLGSIPYQETIAAEVLWTPQEESDTLSEQDLREDYPLLKLLEDSQFKK
ncbi:hypothetical protein KSS87_004681 [Heliosperma pusillum]|nr:hypothetical protein KSS87_004681 [Heliosperma pusillum]